MLEFDELPEIKKIHRSTLLKLKQKNMPEKKELNVIINIENLIKGTLSDLTEKMIVTTAANEDGRFLVLTIRHDGFKLEVKSKSRVDFYEGTVAPNKLTINGNSVNPEMLKKFQEFFGEVLKEISSEETDVKIIRKS